MSQLLEYRQVRSVTDKPVVAFDVRVTTGHGDLLNLNVHGRPVYQIGRQFGIPARQSESEFQLAVERLSVPTASLEVPADILQGGLRRLDTTVVDACAKLFAAGDYLVALWEVHPYLVTPGSLSDYFVREQAAMYRRERRDPGTQYYRAAEDHRGGILPERCFEFIFPRVPLESRQEPIVEQYKDLLARGATPTAVAVSVLERDGRPRATAPWCLTHCLLDGHHKTYAAAALRRPLTLLSFVSIGYSARDTDVARVLEMIGTSPLDEPGPAQRPEPGRAFVADLPDRPKRRPASDLPGLIDGRFRVIRQLGQGGMGRVYLAQDESLGREVAVKVLKEEINDEETRGRFRREGQAVARLRHRHIVSVLDVGEHEGHPFLVMRYVRGETLEDILRSKTALTLVRKLELLDALCDGLAHAHRTGIVHRDIKPGNLIVEDSGTLMIVDFGIAKFDDAQHLTRMGVRPGTYNYMSPEQHMGHKIDQRSDIFAVGAVAHELFTGEQAFPGTLPAVMFRIVHVDPPPVHSLVEGLDPELSGIVSKALAKAPDQRYQDLASLRQELATVRRRLAGGPAKPPEPPQRGDVGRTTLDAPESHDSGPKVDVAAQQVFDQYGVPAFPGCKYVGVFTVSGADDDHRIHLAFTAVASIRAPAALVDFYRDRLPGWTFEPKGEGGTWSIPKDAPEAQLSVFGVAELRTDYGTKPPPHSLSIIEFLSIARLPKAKPIDQVGAECALGEQALLSGDNNRAFDHAQRAYALAPNDRRAADLLARARAARAAEECDAGEQALRDGDPDRAYERSERALVIAPQDRRAMDLKERARAALRDRNVQHSLAEAQRHLDAGELTAAAAALERARQFDPNAPALRPVREALARARAEKGEEAKAREETAAARQLFAEGQHDIALQRLRRLGNKYEFVRLALEELTFEFEQIRNVARKQREGERQPAEEVHAREETAAARQLFAEGQHDIAIQRLRRLGRKYDFVRLALEELTFEFEQIRSFERKQRERDPRAQRPEPPAGSGTARARGILHELYSENEPLQPGRVAWGRAAELAAELRETVWPDNNRPRRLLSAVIGMTVLVTLLEIWSGSRQVRRGGGTSTPVAPVPASSTSSQPPPSQNDGVMALHIAPWGAIDSIVRDGDGLDLTSRCPRTPCSFAAPAGAYTVKGKNPSQGPVMTMRVTVTTGKTELARIIPSGVGLAEQVGRVIAPEPILREPLRLLFENQPLEAIAALNRGRERSPNFDTTSPASRAKLHAYLGVAYATLAFWNEKDKSFEPLRNSALEEFGRALALQPTFRFPESLVSPRVISLFERRRLEMPAGAKTSSSAPLIPNRPVADVPRPPAATAKSGGLEGRLATVTGKVVDDWFRPVSGAQVLFADLASTLVVVASTNPSGEFSRAVSAPAKYRVTASKNGLSQSFIVDVTVGNNSPLTFALIPAKDRKR